jgi:hypothetical protein
MYNPFNISNNLMCVQDTTREIALDVFQIDNEHDMQQGMKLMNDVSDAITMGDGSCWSFYDC